MFCGVDLGTSSIKLLLMDESGKILKSFQKNIQFITLIQAGQSKIHRTGLSNLLRVWKISIQDRSQ